MNKHEKSVNLYGIIRVNRLLVPPFSHHKSHPEIDVLNMNPKNS